ncbi:MAG: DUF2064 domain-containing protein [Bacteroidota bacterium]
MKEHKTAILIFAQSSLADVERKRLPQGEALFDKLTQSTLSKVQRTGLPFYHFSEKRQVGHTFGERFSHAAKAVFAMGYDNLIAIGNDSPGLRTAHLLKTLNALQTGNTVLGPSADGGFYLMGIHKSQFYRLDLLGLPWQSSSLFKTLSQDLDRLGVVPVRLQTLFDLDTFQDLVSFIGRSGTFSKTLTRTIALIISKRIRHWCFLYLMPEYRFGPIPPNKGSPTFSF